MVRQARPLIFYALTVFGLIFCAFLTWRIALFNFGANLRFKTPMLHEAMNGEALIYAVPGDYARGNLPLDSITAAALFDHWGVSRSAWTVAVSLAACLLLTAACFIMESSLGPVAAAAALLFFYLSRDDLATLYVQSGYAFCVLLVCALLVYRAQKPTSGRTWLLSLALGAALLFRSVLFLFPAALAAREFFGRDGPKRAWFKDSAVLVLVPLLFLIPWVRLGWTAYHDLSLFESHQVEWNIVAGTLGLTQGIEGDWRLLLKRPVDVNRPFWIYRWAAKEILRHPLRYLRGYGRRLAFAFAAHPWIFLVAFLPSWWRRRRKDVMDAALLAAYFLAIHCFMAVQYAYFIPLWPLLCLLAGSSCAAAARTLGRFPNPGAQSLARRVGQWSCLAVLAAALCACAYCEKIVWAAGALGANASPDSRIEAALAAAPKSSWLHFESGQISLKAGHLAAARGQFEDAARLDRSCPMCRLYAAWTEALAGKPSPLLFLSAPPDPQFRPALSVMEADFYLSKGNQTKAERSVRAAYREYLGGNAEVRDKHAGLGRKAFNELKSLGPFENWCLVILGGHDAGPMSLLLEKIFHKKILWRAETGGFPIYTK
ncbi:MAG TPA: hypothetical protein VNK24_01875 [Elusimicrobiota bacterium]|nr:hypothetical protein [Elusimicrobiota bacterium]